MKRGTQIICIEDVIMVSGERCFTAGNTYRTYPYSYQVGWNEVKNVICAKNDQDTRHIIISENEDFFNCHFKVIS